MKHILTQMEAISSALESNINDGDHATIAEQAAELVVYTQQFTAMLQPVTPETARQRVDALDEAIEDLTIARSEALAVVGAHLEAGQDVVGFHVKPGAISRKLIGIDEATVALSGIVEPDDLFERKPLGVPAIEKLLTKRGVKPADRETLMSLFVESKPGKCKVEKV